MREGESSNNVISPDFWMAFSKVLCAFLYYPIGLWPLDRKIGTKPHLERWSVTVSQKRPNKQIAPEPQSKNIQLLSRVASGQKFKGQNLTQRQIKENVRVYAVNSQRDSLTHLFSVPHEKFLPLVFQYEVEITS